MFPAEAGPANVCSGASKDHGPQRHKQGRHRKPSTQPTGAIKLQSRHAFRHCRGNHEADSAVLVASRQLDKRAAQPSRSAPGARRPKHAKRARHRASEQVSCRCQAPTACQEDKGTRGKQLNLAGQPQVRGTHGMPRSRHAIGDRLRGLVCSLQNCSQLQQELIGPVP